MAIALLTMGVCAVPALRAQTAISNFGQPLYGGNYYPGGNFSGLNLGYAVSFVTGAAAVDFTGATFQMFKDPTYSAPSGFEVTLSTGFNVSGPTGVLAVLSGPSNPAVSLTPASFSYTATTPVPLAANTTYWLKMDAFTTGVNTAAKGSMTTNIGGVDAGGIVDWSYNIADNYFTNDGGGFWNASTPAVSYPMYSVQYQAVPEPASWTAIAGLAAVSLVRGRRRRQ